MKNKFYNNCDKLLNMLPEKNIMNINEVAEALGLTEQEALTVIERLRSDKVAGGFGTGPVSRNHHTVTFKTIYRDRIKQARYESFRIFSDVFIKWLALALSIISIVMQLAK